MPASTAVRKRAIFRQVCELIPSHLVPKIARKHGSYRGQSRRGATR